MLPEFPPGSSKGAKNMAIWSYLLLGSLLTVQLAEGRHDKWTVGIPGGYEEAERVAVQHDCKNLGLVRGFSDVYLFEKQQPADEQHLPAAEDGGRGEGDEDEELFVHRTKRELEAHPCVDWVDPQTPQIRVKRDLLQDSMLRQQQQMVAQQQRLQAAQAKQQQVRDPSKMEQRSQQYQFNQQQNQGSASSQMRSGVFSSGALVAPFTYQAIQPAAPKPFNDELWTHQWYLQDSSNVAHFQNGIDLNVEDVWRMGFMGRGVVVSILDDGLEWNHTDILPNYDPRASWDMNNNRSDPFPRYDTYDSNSHGTRCAGEVAMVADNRKCGVGVAPQARIGAIKCLDGEVLDHIESQALLHNIDYIDIYSGSWGPSDNGQVVEGPKRLATHALERGVRFGRGGRGALYVWANGNGGALGDHCNCDGYVNSIYTIAIGGVTQQGQIPFYGERCASTLAVTCSSGAYTDRKIVTTDLHNKCTIDYTGTSAAAPLAAGIYALALEANANLTWRDVQHLTAWTSNPVPIKDNRGWKRNSAGLVYNSRFGFGLMDAKALVESALTWQTVPKKSICALAPSTRLPVYLQSRNMAHAVFVSDGCQREYEHKLKQSAQLYHGSGNNGFPNAPGASSRPTPVIYLEHVQVIVDIEYTSRGNLDIFLVSPSGTVSSLLARRPLDVSKNGFDKWPLMSVHFWGETSYGKWTLIVRDKDGQNNRGFLRNATLVLHGTTSRPAHQVKSRVYQDEQLISSFLDPVLELDEDDIYDLNNFPNEMSFVRDDTHQATFILSSIASERANPLN